jgi:DNA-binding transcriptional LysR family regulator
VNLQELFKENGLSLERLRTLIAVEEAGSIAAAAPDDASRQSLFCRQLAQLEGFFQTELKCKTGRTLRLTPAGKELAKLARQQLHSLEIFRRACRQEPVEVAIGAGDSLLHWLVLPRIQKIRISLPGSVLELHDLQNIVVCQRLQDHVIDFGLLRSDLVTHGSLEGIPLGKFGYSLFIPDRICPRDTKGSEGKLLQQLPLAVQSVGNTVFQRRLGEIAASREWKLNIQLRCQSFPQASEVLATGQMAAILPDLARPAVPVDSVWVYPLKSLADLRPEIFLAWHPHRLETRPYLAAAAEKLASALKFVF